MPNQPPKPPLPDSGKREHFDTGSVRDSREGKGRFDLVMAGFPDALEEQAIHNEDGSAKYGDHNWRKGQPLMRYIDSAIRHLTKYTRGDTDENHRAAAIWNLMAHTQTLALIERGELPQSFDDRPEWMRENAALTEGEAAPDESLIEVERRSEYGLKDAVEDLNGLNEGWHAIDAVRRVTTYIDLLSAEVVQHQLHEADIRAVLRNVCKDFGDNDWPDDLHLGDVIDKHLARYLHMGLGTRPEPS